MDIISLYYFKELSKDLHMTRTAARLYISQQTLSNHIQRLEDYYKTRLLYRKPSLSLTYAGECVLRFADAVLSRQTELEDRLKDIQEDQAGLIRFGASTMRMNACLPSVLPAFSHLYPKVEIRLEDSISRDLEPLVLRGDLDMAVIAKEFDENVLDGIHVMDDQIFLCVPEALLRANYGDDAAKIKIAARDGAQLKDFSRLPFYIFANRLGRQIQGCFDEAGFTPKTSMTSSYTHIITTLGLKGLAAFFATRTNLAARQNEILNDMNIFPLLYRSKPMFQHIFLIRQKGRYMPRYARDFQEMLADHFASSEQEKVERMAEEPVGDSASPEKAQKISAIDRAMHSVNHTSPVE